MTKLENCQDTKEKQRNKRGSHEDIKERQDTMTITLTIFTKEKQSDKRDGHKELRIKETGEWRHKETEPFFWAIPAMDGRPHS